MEGRGYRRLSPSLPTQKSNSVATDCDRAGMQDQPSALMGYQGYYGTEEAKANSSLISVRTRLNNDLLPSAHEESPYTFKEVVCLL